MSTENNPKKEKSGFEWIKSAKSGNSYLCPVGSVQDKGKATDDDLKKVCVDESENPQNS